MSDTEQLSLSWDAHQKSICGGLSHLQQRGEFVDMTLAADGHHVKVHQLVMSLVSPYIKELISSAQCPHPVIFLNNISYTTLCAILEYIYTGEVLVPKCKLDDLIAAGKALHIRGLREMADENAMDPITTSNKIPTNKCISEKFKVIRKKKKTCQLQRKRPAPVPMCKVYVDETNSSHEDTIMDIQDDSIETIETETDIDYTSTLNNSKGSKIAEVTSEDSRKILLNPKVQFTVTYQGGLQAIYNRYIYHLRYYGKKNRTRFWRCIDYSSHLKCPANICTDENNEVIKRSFTHNHPFHDTKILKKLSSGVIYSLFQQAEDIAEGKKKERGLQCSVVTD